MGWWKKSKIWFFCKNIIPFGTLYNISFQLFCQAIKKPARETQDRRTVE